MTEPTNPSGERIAKVLSRAGVASRREAERMIEAGMVTVNGKVIDSPALNVTARDRIVVDGKPLDAPEPARLWLYYKPEGLVTSESDEKGRQTVFESLPEDMPRVMSIGRLDLNSEGLLLLTNDGGLKRRLELPSTGWLRKYRVRVKGNPTDPQLEPLRKGIVVEGERFQPMDVKLDRHQGANAWLTVGLREGKNREIRRAMDSIGVTVNRLIRISYGPFRLNELEPGEVEEIKPRVLKDQLGLTEVPEAMEEGPSKKPRRAVTGGSKGRDGAKGRPADDARPQRTFDAGKPRRAGDAERPARDGEGPRTRQGADAGRTAEGAGSRRPFGDKPARGDAPRSDADRMEGRRPFAGGKPARGGDDAKSRRPGGKSFGSTMATEDPTKRSRPAPSWAKAGPKPGGGKPAGGRPAGSRSDGPKPSGRPGGPSRKPR